MEKGFGGLLYNKRKILKELINEFPGLGKSKDFKIAGPTNDEVMYAEGKPIEPKNMYPEWRDTFKFETPSGKKFDVEIGNKNRRELKNEVRLQLISKEFEDNALVKDFKDDLKQRLENKLGKKFVEDRGGVDAYVRGYFSPERKYQAYKNDMNFLPMGHFEGLKSILKG